MEWIRATYEVDAASSEIDAVARAIATEQSVEMPLEAIRQASVREEIVGRVVAVEPAGEDQAPVPVAGRGPTAGRFRVGIDLSAATVGADPVQLVNMAFGNSSLQDHVRLVDLELPPSLLAGFGGPRFGIDGLRRLVGLDDQPPRALTCAALKPQGMSPGELAELAHTFAAAGIDIVKDDHGLADQGYSPFVERVAACQRAIEAANRATGGSSRYAPSLVGRPAALAERAAIAAAEGVSVVLLAPMLVGVGTFCELVEDHLAGLAVIAHPASAGAARVDPPLLLGALFRLFGADAVIFPNYGGRFAYSAERCRDIADATRRPWATLRPAMPVPAGGMTVERVGELVGYFGVDSMLLVGGALLSAGDALAERSRSFVERVAGESHGRS
jgi:ribulose-bisphosphate carboxylase large chain